jgi:hypothetical protein
VLGVLSEWGVQEMYIQGVQKVYAPDDYNTHASLALLLGSIRLLGS